jgi:serine protease AprX
VNIDMNRNSRRTFRNPLFVLTVMCACAASLLGVPTQAPARAPAQAAAGLFIHLAAFSFDPLQSQPDLQRSLAYDAQEAGEAGAFIVQLSGPVLPAWKQALVDAGAQLGDYVPDYAFLAYLTTEVKAAVEALPFVRWVGPYQPAYRLAADAVATNDTRSYRVLLQPWADAAAAGQALAALASPAAQLRAFDGGFMADLGGSQIAQVARLPGVLWVEPLHLQRLYNDVGGQDIMGGGTAWTNGYNGSGMTIAVADTGLDTGDSASIHQDFAGRVTHLSSWPVVYASYSSSCTITNPGANDTASDKESGHGSHVTGSVAGSGARSSGQIKGLAYASSITFQAVEQYTTWQVPNSSCPNGYYLSGIPDDLRTLLTEAYNWSARTHNNSWGGGSYGVYDIQASQFDDFIHTHPDFLAMTAAGNDGTDANGDGYVDENSISSPATAKNVLTIGASENERATGGYNPGGACSTWYGCWGSDYPTNPTRDDALSNSRQHMAAFSSRGPMADGRIKPDVVAPGTNILSVKSSRASESGWGPYNDYYMYMGGTSMASPLSTGAATLVREFYVEHEGQASPSAALIKATLINTAVDIAGYGNTSHEAGLPIPNNHEGWGRINVGAATTAGRAFVDQTTGVNTGATLTYNYNNTSSARPFKVSLVWSDHPAAALAGTTLVNNLNLRVTAPNGAVYLGNVFSGGWSQTGGSADTKNNVENVYVPSPAVGTWTVQVVGANVPQGPQPFALVVDGTLNAEAFTAVSIAPASAPNNAVLAGAVVRGTGFESGSTVALLRGAQSIPGTGLSVNTSADLITATFNLVGAAPGLWSVRVTNSGGVSATLGNSFTVVDATLADLSVSLAASAGKVQPGNWLTYTIRIRNTGFVAATNVVFTDTLPDVLVFKSLAPVCNGAVQPLPHGFRCALLPTSVAPGNVSVYTLVVSVPVSARGTVVNRVQVAGSNGDAGYFNNTVQAAVAVGTQRAYLPLVVKNFHLAPGTPVLAAIDNADGDGNYVVGWAAAAGATGYTLEEDDNAAFSSPVALCNVSGLSCSASAHAPATYYYRVKANNLYGSGDWSNVQSAVVLVPFPGAPVLNDIDNADGDGNYTVSWAAATYASTYTLEEDDNVGFSSPVAICTGAALSCTPGTRGAGTYYYRVKAANARGDGAWSNVQSVIVQPSAAGWTTIVSEDFEDGWPGPWSVDDDNGSTGGYYYWANRSCRPYSGGYSGWPVGGGANGALLGCGSSYPNDANTWMVFGPFSLQGATAAEFKFTQWVQSEKDYDWLSRLVSTNGTNFYGWRTSGNTGGWTDVVLDLSNVPTLGNLLGQQAVWIAIRFGSDGTVNYAEGAYVDNIVLRKCMSATCAGVQVSGPSRANSGNAVNQPASEQLDR